MKSFILAITSFIATFVLLLQVALAQDDGGWSKDARPDPREEPKHNDSGRRADKSETDGRARNNDNCDEHCPKYDPKVRLGDNTNPKSKSSGGLPSEGGNKSNSGAQ